MHFSGVILQEDGVAIGAVDFFQYLRPFQAPERGKLQTGRFTLVGQTVATLAHGIKNIITGTHALPT